VLDATMVTDQMIWYINTTSPIWA